MNLGKASGRPAPPGRPVPEAPAPQAPDPDGGRAPDRLVFFLSGFDPKGARYYHRLYREGAAARAALGDAAIDVGPRRRLGVVADAWDVRWTPAAASPGEASAPTRTRHFFLRWDDIVRAHWHRSAAQLARDYGRVYGRGFPDGIFRRVRGHSRAAWGMAVFPLAVALAVLVGGGAALWAALHLGAGLSGAIAALLAAAGAIAAWRALARAIDCEWLLRLYAFTRAQALGELGGPGGLEARMDDMAAWMVDRVRARQARGASGDAPPLREVLVVGYSTGSIVASSVLARALPGLLAATEGTGGSPAPALSMLTLGHCVPVGADWSAATGLRAELERLGACERLAWHDWSAPVDWAAFWRTPPWPPGSRLRGLQRSPRFHVHLAAPAYAALRRDRREMHLQYLRAPGRSVEAGGYDWFRFTAGPEPMDAAAAAGRAS